MIKLMESKSVFKWVFLFLIANHLGCQLISCSVTYDSKSIVINGERRILISGSIHYPRSTPEMWEDLVMKAKDGGLDVIDTYVFWNVHEPSPGNVVQLLVKFLVFLMIYGKVFKTHILGRPIIVSTDPDVNKVVLQNQGNVFIPSYPKSVIELLGESSILQMNGGLQKRLHAIVGGFLRSPQFKARITKDIQNSVKLTLSSWMNQDNPRQPLYLQDETKKITFEILVRLLMSVDPGEDMEFLKREFIEVIKGLICLPIKLPGFRMYKSLQAKEKMLKMVGKIVNDRKTTLDKNEAKTSGLPNDVIDVLLRDTGESDGTQQRLPLDFISGNIIEMMIPGEDSVPMIMTLAVKYLSDNPTALACLVEENDKLKKRKDESCEEYAWTDYMSLQFTQGVISETLRMANIINAIWRKALEDVEINGYLIPKGWCVLASLTSVHMDEDNYENPDEFDPWRWEKTGASVKSNKFTPFGGGQRLCPGLEFSRLEISIFLHHLVTTYTWVTEEDQIVYFPTVKTKRKLPIMVTPR